MIEDGEVVEDGSPADLIAAERRPLRRPPRRLGRLPGLSRRLRAFAGWAAKPAHLQRCSALEAPLSLVRTHARPVPGMVVRPPEPGRRPGRGAPAARAIRSSARCGCCHRRYRECRAPPPRERDRGAAAFDVPPVTETPTPTLEKELGERRPWPPGPASTRDRDLVQLLTPEGERVEHPDFSFDLDDEAIKGFYRDLVLTRRIDTEATALQRQGELGIWASAARPGGRPDRLRPGDAAAGLRLPDLPRARRRLVPRRRPAPPARPVPRRRPGRLGPARRQLRPLHDRDRRADAARDRLRDGHAARRRASAPATPTATRP